MENLNTTATATAAVNATATADTTATATAAEMLNLATVTDSFAVKPLAEFKSVELESNQYLVRKIEKGTGLDSKGVIITAIDAETVVKYLESDAVLSGAVDWLQSVIGEVCKKKIGEGARVITTGDYSLTETESYLQEKAISEGRVSKEKIAAWFNSAMFNVLKSAFKAKMPELSEDKLLETIAAYKNAFGLLAKRELALEPQVQQNLTKALELAEKAGKAGSMLQYCQAKIKGSAAKVADMLAL